MTSRTHSFKKPLILRCLLLAITSYAILSCSSEPARRVETTSQETEQISQAQIEQDSSTDDTEHNGIQNEPNIIDKETVEDLLEEKQAEVKTAISGADLISALCTEIGNKLGSVDVADCLNQQLRHSSFSVEQRSLAYRDFSPLPSRQPLGKILVIGGIHGDEFSSVSVVFKWMEILQEHHSGLFHWRFIPSANPDGLVQKNSTRQNANGVDLNRNFPTGDWEENALKYWRNETRNNARRFPGKIASSEPETQWLIEQIESFNPDVIISMHAPYHLVDYDGPPTAPNQLGSLYLRQLGVYPGSMGNYIGVDKNKPIVTVELKSAGIMPTDNELNTMWTDLIQWLRSQLDKSGNRLDSERSSEEIAG